MPRRKKIAPAGTPLADEPELLRAWSADKKEFSKDELDAWMVARVKAGTFSRSQNPVHALDSFCVSVGAGLVPDKGVLQFLEAQFLQWLKAQGKQRLDSIMGLNAVGRYQSYERVLLENRDWELFCNMAKLRSLPAITLPSGETLRVRISCEDAATMALKGKVDPGWLVKKYRKIDPPWLEALMRERVTKLWTPQKIREEVSNFPRHTWPYNLREFVHSLRLSA